MADSDDSRMPLLTCNKCGSGEVRWKAGDALHAAGEDGTDFVHVKRLVLKVPLCQQCAEVLIAGGS